MDKKNDISKLIIIDREFETKDEKWVDLRKYEDSSKLTNHRMQYAKYLMMLELNRWLEPYEYIYHINRDFMDNRIDNFKIIDTRPIDIEVKYPYDPEKYKASKCWYKRDRAFLCYMHLKSEYRTRETPRKRNEIRIPMHKYIAETEKLKRFLDKDERVIYIDEDRLNYSEENLKILKSNERGNINNYPIGKVPFQDYCIGKEFNEGDRIKIQLMHRETRSKNTTISRSKYRYELKLGRFLKENERLVYKDGNHLNDDIDNLTHKELGQAEHPFEDYYISKIYTDSKSGRKSIYLKHKTNPEENLPTMLYSRYRKQIIEGRIFSKDEDIEVDHIDANPYNDANDNLQILTKDEHRKKSAQERTEIAPNISILCDGCNEEFEKLLSAAMKNLNKFNNLFCSSECRWNYIREGNKIQNKKLIKYTCAGTGREIYIPENAKFLSSKFNPDALPFYDRSAVLKWIKEKQSIGDEMYHSIGSSPNFPISSIIGSSASKSIIDNINTNMRSHTYLEGNSGFQFSDSSNKFIEEIVLPIKQSMLQVENLKSKLNSVFVDEIRPLTRDEDFYNIPQKMMLPMLSFPKLQPLMEQGRISGFGIDADLKDLFLPYYRIAYSGYVEDALENIYENDGKLLLNFEFTSIDPEITEEQCSYLRDTYEKMSEMIDNNLDPTMPGATIS